MDSRKALTDRHTYDFSLLGSSTASTLPVIIFMANSAQYGLVDTAVVLRHYEPDPKKTGICFGVHTQISNFITIQIQ